MTPKDKHSLSRILAITAKLKEAVDSVYFDFFDETSFRLLNELELTAHALSVSAASKRNHPYLQRNATQKQKNQKLQGSPRWNPSVTQQVILLIEEFGLDEFLV